MDPGLGRLLFNQDAVVTHVSPLKTEQVLDTKCVHLHVRRTQALEIKISGVP